MVLLPHPQKAFLDLKNKRKAPDLRMPFSNFLYFAFPLEFCLRIHPRIKFEVGRRLAVSALNVVYGQKELPPSGPTISSCKFEMDRGKLAFTIQFNATMMKYHPDQLFTN